MVLDTLGITVFAVVSVAFVLAALVAGGVVRPRLPNPDKADIYECGEPTIGPGWVQFDLRFYVVALVYVIFDVEIALLYPWALVFRQYAQAAFWDLAFFFGVLLIGYAYLWKFGYLDWVRATGEPGTEGKAAVGGQVGS